MRVREPEEMMQNVVNRRWLLARYPEGMPSPEDWTLETQQVPDPGLGQILVKAKWLSVDPYMRGRMSPSANYTKGVAIGESCKVAALVKSSPPAIRRGKSGTSRSL
jgi:NADPH-dependent curcumin reductase CurA